MSTYTDLAGSQLPSHNTDTPIYAGQSSARGNYSSYNYKPMTTNQPSTSQPSTGFTPSYNTNVGAAQYPSYNTNVGAAQYPSYNAGYGSNQDMLPGTDVFSQLMNIRQMRNMRFFPSNKNAQYANPFGGINTPSFYPMQGPVRSSFANPLSTQSAVPPASTTQGSAYSNPGVTTGGVNYGDEQRRINSW